ncbi:HlyD family efflux transporter periplasmic adaptor subunit [Geminocystis sp. CENA526]|uniref:HlyD family efflux transporter periplasmic adaptor subunit n=1 Tax=Geminocystis sp. CENA526 TaxID=1355871 RepID=UPI003D6E8F5C
MLQTINVFTKHNKKLVLAVIGVGILITGGIIIYTLRQTNSISSYSENPVNQPAPITSVSALGRIEPSGQVIRVAPSPNMGGAKVGQLLVKEGDEVTQGQTIAILDDYETKKASVATAKTDVEVARANLSIVQAGAKQGEIEAQQATIKRLEAQLQGEIATNKTRLSRLKAQLNSEKLEKQATIQRQSAELENARVEWQRYQQLASEGAISQSELDQKKLIYDTARERYGEAKASYDKTVNTLNEEIREIEAISVQSVNTLEKQIQEGRATLAKIEEVREVDVNKAQAELNRSIALLTQAEADLKLSYIKTPSDGQIIDIKAYEGENIDMSTGIVELANTKQMRVIAEVYESDINKVKLGQQAVITSENGAFAGEIKGIVVDIGRQIGKKDVLNTDPAADVDARVVEVKIDVRAEDTSKIASLIYSKVLARILLDIDPQNNVKSQM